MKHALIEGLFVLAMFLVGLSTGNLVRRKWPQIKAAIARRTD